MLSDRVQRRIDTLLDDADDAIKRLDWAVVRERAEAVLALDAENADAAFYRAAAEKALGVTRPNPPAPFPRREGGATAPPRQGEGQAAGQGEGQPTSFAEGRYEVRRFLGEGGKKKVYLAHDVRLNRDVAFALIKTQGLDADGLARITREAQAMAKLGDHPSIVTVFDIGEEPIPFSPSETQPYLVTELLVGGDVEGLIEHAPDHRLTLERAVELADQVCCALEHAHAHQFVHRDVKPGNVWLTQDGVAKLGDFGLVVSLTQARLTQAGMMVGTVSYMPPEQAVGGQPVSQSDLYSLGCMLYKMVTGRPPFVADETVAATQHLNVPPVSPRWHNPDCPPALERLILRLLEKDPARRPASAAAVRQSLATALAPVIHTGLTQVGPSPLAAADNPLYRRAFVGREPELRQFQTAFDRAHGGQGTLALVVGEPGIGKTALCEQAATYAIVRGGRVLMGHCYEEGSFSLPYLAFVEAMRSYVLARPPEALKEDLGTGAADVARIVSEIRERVNVDLRPSGDPEEDRWRLLQAVTEFLKNVAREQPLVLVLEDLHWADRGTLDLLTHLARNLEVADSTGRGTRILIIGTYRDIEVDRAHPLSAALGELRRGASLQRVLLRGLTPDEVHRMLSAIAGHEVAWGLAEAVHRQTEGNPLFIQEVVRYLVEEGLLTKEGSGRTGSGADLTLAIPEGLRDVIGRRMARLSPECNRLLQVAAVISRDFALETLEAVVRPAVEGRPTGSPLPDDDPILNAIEEAVRVGVLEDQSKGAAIRYRFAHAFFRQTLYEEMIAPRRIRYHQQVARVLEAQYAAGPEEHAAELAEHFGQSSDAGDLAKAVHYCEVGAQRALAVYAYSEAVRRLEEALDIQEVVDPDDKAKRCDLLLTLGEALLPAGEPRRVYEVVAEEVFRLAEGVGDHERTGRACQLAVMALRRYGGITMRATPAFRRWTSLFDRFAGPGTVARVYADIALAQVAERGGDNAEAWSLGQRALALARKLGDPGALFEAAAWLLLPPYGPAYMAEARPLAAEFLERPREGVSPRTLAEVLEGCGCAVMLLRFGDRPRAEEARRQRDELVQRTKDPDLLLSAADRASSIALIDGRLEEALAGARRAAALGAELGSPVHGESIAESRSQRPLLLLGRADDALAAFGRTAATVGNAESSAGTTTTGMQALIYAHAGRREEARTHLSGVLKEHHIGPVEDGRIGLASLIVSLEAAVAVDDHEIVTLMLERLHALPPMSIASGGAPGNTCPARHLGAAAALLGDRVQARRYHAQALEMCAKIGFRPEIALTRLGMAELLLEEAEDVGTSRNLSLSGDRTAEDLRREANEHLDFAIAEFREMKMQPSLERALRHKGLLGA